MYQRNSNEQKVPMSNLKLGKCSSENVQDDRKREWKKEEERRNMKKT